MPGLLSSFVAGPSFVHWAGCAIAGKLIEAGD
jgi:hypothetical protein